jgi:hypothetical protein
MGIVVASLLVLVLAVLAWWIFSTVGAGKAGKVAEQQDTTDPRVETLRYRIPDAQDPTVLISALEQEGYTADLDDVRAEKYLVVACPAGRDRERAHVRSLIDGKDKTSLEGPEFNPGKVVFEDEK